MTLNILIREIKMQIAKYLKNYDNKNYNTTKTLNKQKFTALNI